MSQKNLETSWIDADQVLTIDFSDADWKTKYPDRFTVEDSSLPFYVDNTFTYNEKSTYRCGETPNNGKSESSIKITTIEDGILEFNYTDSSESNYDKMHFALDGTEVFTQGNMDGWKVHAQPITAGTHTLTFSYTRDNSGASGKNACAIGYLKFSKVTPDFEILYLVKSENSLYTTINDKLQPLDVEEVTGAIFQEFGVTEIPTGDLIKSLVNPIILQWSDSTDFISRLHATVTATPMPQVFESANYKMEFDYILGIEKVEAIATESVQFAVSIDNGVTWMAYLQNAWVVLSEVNSGMSTTTVNAITSEQWNSLVTGRQFKLRIALMDNTSTFTNLRVDYINSN